MGGSRSQALTLAVVFLIAASVAVVGLTSGLSQNVAPVNAAGGRTVGCGSPWAPDYTAARAEDAAVQDHTGEVTKECATMNEREGLFATAATPGSLVVVVLVLAVAAAEVRHHRSASSARD